MRNLMRAAAGTCALFLGAITTSADDAKTDKDKNKTPFTDQQFVVLAGSGGMHEVALGKLAQTNAGSEDVKSFGKKLEEDHAKANKDLMTAAKSANVGFPTSMLPDQQRELARMTRLKGPEFDKEFIKHQVADHKKDIALFERATKEATSAQLKQFATKALPTLKEHLKMAEKIQGSLKGK
jgi:putative membrane protein